MGEDRVLALNCLRGKVDRLAAGNGYDYCCEEQKDEASAKALALSQTTNHPNIYHETWPCEQRYQQFAAD